MEAVQHYTAIIKQAKEAEAAGEHENAKLLYEKAIQQQPIIEQPYNRLMVLYRKDKEYGKELKVLKLALNLFSEQHDKKKAQFSGSGKVAQLSKALLKSLGSKQTDENYYPQPIPKWLKRKAVVEKKLK